MREIFHGRPFHQGQSRTDRRGAKNLGGLIARDLAQHGAKAVAIHYNSAASKADADATVAAIQAAGIRRWRCRPT